jgi:hypothetical protein
MGIKIERACHGAISTCPTKNDHIQGHNKWECNPKTLISFAFENPTEVTKREKVVRIKI